MCEPVQKPLLDCDWLSRTSRRCVEHLFFTYLNLVRIPKWNAGKRWYSGPSASGRGGHGNGRGRALRVARDRQGRETSTASPRRCRSCSQFQLTALGSLRKAEETRRIFYAKSRRAAKGCHELRSGREAERVWVKEVPDGGTYKDAASKVGIVEGRDVATWASTVQCQE